MPKVIADITMSLDGFVTGEAPEKSATAQGLLGVRSSSRPRAFRG